jgi:hypothetical protein
MQLDAFLTQFWPNFIGTVVGGFALSFIFFLLKEWVFPVPNLTGTWECELTTGKTALRAHEGMKLWYRVTILQRETQVTGIGELHREVSTTGDRIYKGSGRRVVEVSGCVTKRIFRPDLIQITWSEQGRDRIFSNVFFLHFSGPSTSGNLWGRYESTASESSGHSLWRRVST